MAYRLVLIAAGGSLALLLGAFAFQHIGGLPPCKLCIWQRYPHGVAAVLGVGALVLGARWLGALAMVGAAAALTTAGVGLYHVGVEQGWWPGPNSCSGGALGSLDSDALFDQIMAAPLVRCDDITWAFLGLSMAGWNAVLSLGLAGIWVLAARRA